MKGHLSDGLPALLPPVLHLDPCFGMVRSPTPISVWVLRFIHLLSKFIPNSPEPNRQRLWTWDEQFSEPQINLYFHPKNLYLLKLFLWLPVSRVLILTSFHRSTHGFKKVNFFGFSCFSLKPWRHTFSNNPHRRPLVNLRREDRQINTTRSCDLSMFAKQTT